MMARTQQNRQLRPLHLFICEDSKSSKYYMQGLGKANGINIKAEEAYGTSPENVLRSAKEKQKLFKDKGTVQIYCLFDKDDCDDEKFKKVIQQCKKAGFVDAIRCQNNFRITIANISQCFQFTFAGIYPNTLSKSVSNVPA